MSNLETQAQEKIGRLRLLQNTMEQRKQEIKDTENELNELLRKKEEVYKRLFAVNYSKRTQIQKEVDVINHHIKNAEIAIKNMKMNILKLESDINLMGNEISRLIAMREDQLRSENNSARRVKQSKESTRLEATRAANALSSLRMEQSKIPSMSVKNLKNSLTRLRVPINGLLEKNNLVKELSRAHNSAIANAKSKANSASQKMAVDEADSILLEAGLQNLRNIVTPPVKHTRDEIEKEYKSFLINIATTLKITIGDDRDIKFINRKLSLVLHPDKTDDLLYNELFKRLNNINDIITRSTGGYKSYTRKQRRKRT